MSATSIEWADAVWNPVRGCSLVSAGCTNCYAMRQAHRFSGAGGPYHGLTKASAHGPVWTGRARVVPEMLDVPLRWKKPRRIFVDSMSDLFHENVPFEFISAVFGIMAMAPQHTFQILTKRPARALEWVEWIENDADGPTWGCILHAREIAGMLRTMTREPVDTGPRWPLQNVWLGVSVEDQASADERIPLLMRTRAAIRFLSCEPLLEEVDLTAIPRVDPEHPHPRHYDRADLDWVIVGGESGPGARPFNIAWARSIIAQCRAADVPVFVKQLGAQPFLNASASFADDRPGLRVRVASLEIDTSIAFRDRAGGDPAEWPADLRVREFAA